jgi:hypothetical protein
MKMTINDVSLIIQKANEAARNAGDAIEQYKAENPDIDVEAVLREQNELLPIIRQLSSRELDKFVAYAKEQGTKMPFDTMEMGILAAGRMDMKNGLAEILDAMKFDKPEGTDDRGRSKKKS